MRALMFALLAGCAMHAAVGTSTSAPEPAPAAVESSPQPFANMIVRSQLAQLLGKTPDEAHRLLKSFGHVGRFAVEASKTYYEGCQPGRVCDFSVAPAGMGVEDDMILYTQKELPATTAPPP